MLPCDHLLDMMCESVSLWLSFPFSHFRRQCQTLLSYRMTVSWICRQRSRDRETRETLDKFFLIFTHIPPKFPISGGSFRNCHPQFWKFMLKRVSVSRLTIITSFASKERLVRDHHNESRNSGLLLPTWEKDSDNDKRDCVCDTHIAEIMYPRTFPLTINV